MERDTWSVSILDLCCEPNNRITYWSLLNIGAGTLSKKLIYRVINDRSGRNDKNEFDRRLEVTRNIYDLWECVGSLVSYDPTIFKRTWDYSKFQDARYNIRRISYYRTNMWLWVKKTWNFHWPSFSILSNRVLHSSLAVFQCGNDS